MAKARRLGGETLAGSFVFTGNIDDLARCHDCFVPLYCVYDMNLRLFCHDCEQVRTKSAARRKGEA
jgi:hypothetical protein